MKQSTLLSTQTGSTHGPHLHSPAFCHGAWRD